MRKLITHEYRREGYKIADMMMIDGIVMYYVESVLESEREISLQSLVKASALFDSDSVFKKIDDEAYMKIRLN